MKKRKAIKYIGLTLALTVVCTAVFFALSVSDVLGKFVPEVPYVTEEPEVIVGTKDYVTPQKDTATPLTSENKKLPEIPTTIGKKGTKTNPFIVLEIVPDHSEQALSYLVPSKEEGLPFDPMELGIRICKEYGMNIVDYKDRSGNFSDFLGNTIGGVFNNNNHYKIYSGNGEDETPVQYSYIKKYYDIEVDSDKLEVSDFDSMTVAQLAEKYKDVFEKDGSEKIRDIALQDESGWEKVKTETKRYDYQVTDFMKIQSSEYDTLTVSELAAKYPEVFSKDSWGNEIEKEAIEDEAHWKKKKESRYISTSDADYTPLKNGYFYNAGAGKGDYAADDLRWATFEKSETESKNQWIFVSSKEELPEGAYNIWDKGYNRDTINPAMENGELTGGYFAIADSKGGWDSIFCINAIQKVYYTYTYQNTKYTMSFKYYGLAVNDILKRRLFYRETEKEYENFHMKVISLTPAEINEMDKNDTADTLSYIERADMFYVAMFDELSLNAGIKNQIEFYHKYVADKPETEEATLYDYTDNDLEWVDCMKIMQRLAGNKNLPIMYENEVGNMLGEGVNGDGSTSCHIYLNENNTDEEQVGSLNNIAKLYLTTVQLDLTKKTSGSDRIFIRDIYPNFQQIKLAPQKDANPNSAKYTGYYARLNGQTCSCDQSEDYKKRCFYLWGKAMFLPNDVEALNDFSRLVSEYGYLQLYIDGKDPSNFQNNKYNGGLNVANSTRGDDEKNVAIVYDNPTNKDKTILNDSMFNTMGPIMEMILANGGKDPEDLIVSVRKNKKEYVRMNDENVMLDYSPEAKYKTDKTITLKCKVQNPNNEDSIIKSISFINEETDDKIVMKPSNVEKEDVSGLGLGYRVPANSYLDIELPFSRAKWQSGYTTVSVTTVSRVSYIKARKKLYANGAEREAQISIVGRRLFNLE